ncbi:hypothetical protein C8Q75DRAFT_777595 [Abortiporus biennis]|nr:hypothetical protein C8Q75DRAFT_777595 [Abortiporus biennis]
MGPRNNGSTISDSSSTTLHRSQLQVLKFGRPYPPKSNFMAAIHTLPVELLTRVFVLGCEDEPDPDDRPLGKHPFEVLVSHVCQHWRDLAIRTAVMWTLIHIRTVPHMDRARAYLTRSMKAMIDIFIDTCSAEEHQPGYTLFREEFHQVFGIVVPEINRWKSISLKVRDLVCKRGAREVFSSCGSAVNLQRLQLWHIEDWGTSERLFTAIGPPPVVIFNSELPSLKDLSLIGVNVPWAHVNFLKELTSVDFALHSNDVRIPYGIWERMLRESPDLQKLNLHYSGPRSGFDDWLEETIPLLKLQEISLTDLDPSYLMMLFRRIKIPNVKRFSVELPEQDFTPFVEFLVDPPPPYVLRTGNCEPVQPVQEDGEDDDEETSSKLKKSWGPVLPHLENLSISALECTTDSWRKFLQTLKHVEHVEIDFARMAEGTFEELMYIAPEATSSSTTPSPTDPNGKGKGRAVSPLPRSTSSCVVLPSLKNFRISGVSMAQIRGFITFRRGHRLPLTKWILDELLRDEEMDIFVEKMGLSPPLEGEGWENLERVEWFKAEDDDDEEGDEDEDEDDGEGDGEDGGEEDDLEGDEDEHAEDVGVSSSSGFLPPTDEAGVGSGYEDGDEEED